MRPNLEAFLRRLRYQFSNPQLLLQALSHRSSGSLNNERLEYLGDAVLDLVVGEMLYEKFPTADEGALSNMRSQMVCQPALAAKARDLGIPEVLVLGQSASRSGGHQRDSILSDTLEALIGAMFLDSEWNQVREFIRREMPVDDDVLVNLAVRRDAKSRLQEFLQARRLPPPKYALVEISGPGHSQNFLVSCEPGEGLPTFQGQGSSRRAAEQMAAASALDYLVALATAR